MSKKKLWGGRFSKGTNQLVEKFSNSIALDQELALYDCAGSLYHIDVLKKAKLLTVAEHKKLKSGLNALTKDIQAGKLRVDAKCEDIHTFVQEAMEKKVGKTALKLHTCRSRNDQVVLDVKLYCLKNIQTLIKKLLHLNNAFTNLAMQNKNLVIPGYTHLQHAIPVALKDYLCAICQMLSRDGERLANAYDNIDLTFGSGALAGTMIPASCYRAPAPLHVNKAIEPTTAPIDSVGDRDFIIEILSALAIMGMHLSRLSEDLILWASNEFGFIDIDDGFCTGSSLMPQKKNPDVLELVRGMTGPLYGNLMNVLVMMKGLPLAYNRDMQWDKEPLFDSVQKTGEALDVMTQLLLNTSFNEDKINIQLQDECLYATDIADHLVSNKVAFKEAHAIVGRLISTKLKKGISLLDMNDKALKTFHPSLTKASLRKILSPSASVKAKRSIKR